MNSLNWVTFTSKSSKHKSSFTPHYLMNYPLSKKLNLTFEIFQNGFNKMVFFICYLHGKDIFKSKDFQKLLKRRTNTKTKCFKLMKDHSEKGVQKFLKFVCMNLNLSENKRSFFIIRYFNNSFRFVTWTNFL